METVQQSAGTASGIIPQLFIRLSRWFKKDPRQFQITFLSIFLLFGSLALGWHTELVKFLLTFSVCLLTQAFFTYKTGGSYSSLRSALISALSLCLMLKTNLLFTTLLAAFLSIAGKFVIRFKNKHVFNPTNFGIIMTLVLTGDAWISPGQWGSDALFIFFIGLLGLTVLLEVKRLDTAFAFLLAFGTYHFLRSSVYLGWTTDVVFHQFSSGTLLLFAFFMITDPVTTPNHLKARIAWAAAIGLLAAFLQTRYWINGAPLWALFLLSPFTPLIDLFFKGDKFEWNRKKTYALTTEKKSGILPPSMSVAILAIFLFLASAFPSSAFCGFYVARADAALFNKASQVILVRDGEKSTITMSSDFSGDLSDFAMVVPVPVVLNKSDIRIVERSLFDAFDAYSGPRLVEYWDQNPCHEAERAYMEMADMPTAAAALSKEERLEVKNKSSVKIEAKYAVGEYDILILSSRESNDLEVWLKENGYKIPAGARDVLEPYILSGMKFFVVKVNLDEFRKQNVNILRPLQITFNSPKFMLPIRLGMANANGTQDMIVYALSKTGRIETTNYRTVQIPTDRKIPEFVKNVFGKFYADLYAKTLRREGMGNVFLEYAWDISGYNFVKCDPCASTPPMLADLRNAGAGWIQPSRNGAYDGNVFFTRLHVTYDRKHFPQDLVFQETPNKENFQGRYILTHPAQGSYDCKEGARYLHSLRDRRYKELQELASHTDWDISIYRDYLDNNGQYTPPQPVQQKIIKPDIRRIPDTMGFVSPAQPAIGMKPATVPAPSAIWKDNSEAVLTSEQAAFTPVYIEQGKERISPMDYLRYTTMALLSLVLMIVLIGKRKT